MNLFKNIVLILLTLITLFSCKSKNTDVVNSKVGNELIYPIMPMQQQAYLFENVEMIDYIFQDLPYSLSQSEIPSIQTKIAGISQEGVPPNNCAPFARMFFQIRGEILFEADVYFSLPDCHHYVFIENGKPIYANQMGQQNISFYTQFLKQMNVAQ